MSHPTHPMNELEQRIRANSCPISGLTTNGYEKHIQAIVLVITRTEMWRHRAMLKARRP